MLSQWDVIVIGAGPSGMSAAGMAAKIGLQVLVVDEQPSPGGQIYKNITGKNAGQRFHDDELSDGTAVINGFFNQENICYYPNTVVWFIEKGRILCSMEGKKKEFKGIHIVVATGAMERPVPFRGWTLPGVMTAGSADLLHKSSGVLPHGPVVIAGNGPLLEKIQMTLHQRGVEIAAVADMSSKVKQAASLIHIPKALGDMSFLFKGAMMKKENLFSRVKTVSQVTGIRAEGEGAFEKLVLSTKRGDCSHFRGKTLLYHQGVIPRTHITKTLNVEHAWDRRQRYWYPKTDRYGATNVSGVHVVGDGAFVHGAAASVCKGELAALDIALQMGCICVEERKNLEKNIRSKYRKSLCTRDFIDGWFAPSKDIFHVDDDVTVCRCEGGSAGDIRNAVLEGCLNVNDIKIRTRCGMGPCQGRMCSSALSEIAARAAGVSPETMEPLKSRSPIRPIPFGEACSIAEEPLPN